MPYSFWIFLFVCILSFIPSALDHGETWKNFKSCSGCEKIKLGLRLFGLWVIPFLFLLATLLSGYETKDDANDKKRQTDAVFSLSNQLNAAAHQINVQSNALAAAKIKPLKERLIDCLNSLDVKIIPAFRHGQTNFQYGILQYQYNRLRDLADESGASEYLEVKPSQNGNVNLQGDGQIMYGTLELKPPLLE